MGNRPIHRQGDFRAAHTGAIVPTVCQTGSADVFIEGQAAERAGVDQYAVHGVTVHAGTATPGSATVFVNDSPAVRGNGGDEIDECPADGGTLSGATTVYIS